MWSPNRPWVSKRAGTNQELESTARGFRPRFVAWNLGPQSATSRRSKNATRSYSPPRKIRQSSYGLRLAAVESNDEVRACAHCHFVLGARNPNVLRRPGFSVPNHAGLSRPPNGIGLPRGPITRLGYSIAHFEQDLQIFHGAAQVPVGFGDVGGLVIVVGDVVGAFL